MERLPQYNNSSNNHSNQHDESWIDRDEMNPNNDRNSHISINSRKPNDEHDYSYWSHPPRRSGTYSD